MVARDAVFLISLATEEFIKRLSEASQQVAEREKRATVQHRDVGLLRSICWVYGISKLCIYSYSRQEGGGIPISRWSVRLID